MSETTVTTGFFGFGDGKGNTQTGVPEAIQAATAAILAGGIPQFKTKTENNQKTINAMFFTFDADRRPRVMSVTLTNLGGSSTIAKINGEMQKYGMLDVFEKLVNNAPDSEINLLLNEKFEAYNYKCDANKIKDAKGEIVVPGIDELISNCKEAGIGPQIINKIRDIRDMFVNFSKKKLNDAAELAGEGPQLSKNGELVGA